MEFYRGEPTQVEIDTLGLSSAASAKVFDDSNPVSPADSFGRSRLGPLRSMRWKTPAALILPWPGRRATARSCSNTEAFAYRRCEMRQPRCPGSIVGVALLQPPIAAVVAAAHFPIVGRVGGQKLDARAPSERSQAARLALRLPGRLLCSRPAGGLLRSLLGPLLAGFLRGFFHSLFR